MAACIFDRFPAAVHAMAARCKLSFTIRPGLSREDRRRSREMTNERQEGSTFSLLFRGCHKGGRGAEQRFLDLGAQPLSLSSPLLLSLSPLPELPLRGRALRVLVGQRRDQPPYIRGGADV